MSKNILLYVKEELTFKDKFYTLMDLLISKQAESLGESIFLMIFFYLQILSSFFSDQIGIFNSKNGKSDIILNYIEKIIRLKGLFRNYYSFFLIIRLILFILIILIIIHFLLSCLFMRKTSYYSYNCIIINYYIKIFIFVAYNIFCDICFSSFCIGLDGYNPHFNNITCSSQKKEMVIIVLFFAVISLYLFIFINVYYIDLFYLSNSYFSKMSCNYDTYWAFNCAIISLLSSQAKFLTKELFLIYNFIISIFLFFYYIKHYIYYNKYINILTGIFHLLYVWTSIFCFIFSHIKFKEKGIVYILISIIVGFFYFNIKNRIDNYIFLDIPFYKIRNKYYLLYYFKSLIDIINNIKENSLERSFLSGVIKMHKVECPNPNCIVKTKGKLYLPSLNKWNDQSKKEVEDHVFLANFIVIIMNYFLFTHECSADMYLNLSLYYLMIIGNYCQSIYFYKKVSELKLTSREKFSFIRLNLKISKALNEKLKPPNEQCSELENLNVSMYYKYDALSQNFLDAINKDVNLSLEFWKEFRAQLKEENKKLDFNNIFKLTDEIRITKKAVEDMWNNLIQIYGGVNDFFELYMEYLEKINDDDLKKRDLESFRRRNDNSSDHINNNFYYVLFNKETGIIIANGDKGSEGIIELSNNGIENIFGYKCFDLKGMNLTNLMPKLFARDHSKYIEDYFNIGEKKIIDKSNFKSFGKDKNNFMIKIKLAIKLFPVLNDQVYFTGLIVKENLDDIILLDDEFNIQGMSQKLMRILNINNNNLFQENEIPFYVICKKFLNFYSIFFKGNKKADISQKQLLFIEDEDLKERKEENKNENIKNENIHENIEISENVELEYEIKLPQFLIDYSEKTNKREGNNSFHLISLSNEEDAQNDVIDEYDETDLLIDEKEKNQILIPTPTPEKEIYTPEGIHISDSGLENSDIVKNNKQKNNNNKPSEDEKQYHCKIEDYKSLFKKGRIKDLEQLIDNFNKNSSSVEYKFNFTFDKYRYGNKQVSYIVRCIDNKNDIGVSQEESLADLEPNVTKYKKEKEESIKPYFEILENEKKEIIELPESFLKLSLENKKFQNLLEICKNEINSMSKLHGQKKEEILEDENSSQSSQSGFDNGLVKKNRIEEIRSDLLTNISSFYTIKYIKIIISLIILISVTFSSVYIIFFKTLKSNLKHSSNLNLNLLLTSFWTTELIGTFISLRVLFIRDIIGPIYNPNRFSFLFNDYLTEDGDTDPINYYKKNINISKALYKKLLKTYALIEMEIPKYLDDTQLMNIYWNRINISYINETYRKYKNKSDDESFPMAMNQLLSNTITFFESDNFNSIEKTNFSNDNKNYFEYMTYLIIENGYNNILPNQFEKLKKIPDILSNYNFHKITTFIFIICFYGFLIIMLCVIYSFLIHLTNRSMTVGMEKVTAIKLEKIEEIIKRIKNFSLNLKRFREKDIKSEDNKDMLENDNGNNLELNKIIDSDVEKIKNKIEQGTKSINNSLFNLDNKKYIPLSILNYSFLFSIFIILISFGCLIPIFIITKKIVKSTNQLLIVQNYIFGKLIAVGCSVIEIKCFMSECRNENNFKKEELVNEDLIQEVIRGVSLFPQVDYFYNYKYLLDACAASIKNTDSEEYKSCILDSLILSANNTENLIKLIDDLVDNIQKEYDMYKGNKQNLFNSSYFRQIEYMFYNYIFEVGDNFGEILNNDLNDFLDYRSVIVIFIAAISAIVILIYCLIFGLFFTRKLVHHLSVSRCIMKIIPTSVIVSTQELEAWIENNY